MNRDFYPRSGPVPLDEPGAAWYGQAQGAAHARVADFRPQDQADGLRRLFAGRRRAVLPLVANPHVAFGGQVLDRLASALAQMERHVLVLDAASTSPPPPELAAVDLALCVETVSPRIAYLPAGGLATAYVDTRGSAEGLLDAAQRAAPACDAILVHADAADLLRIFRRRAARPMLLGADHPESIKHAYAGAKLLALRGQMLTFDLLLATPPQSPRAAAIAKSLAGCVEGFLGGLVQHHVQIDPAGAADAPLTPALAALLGAQLALDDGSFLPFQADAARRSAAAAAPTFARG